VAVAEPSPAPAPMPDRHRRRWLRLPSGEALVTAYLGLYWLEHVFTTPGFDFWSDEWWRRVALTTTIGVLLQWALWRALTWAGRPPPRAAPGEPRPAPPRQRGASAHAQTQEAAHAPLAGSRLRRH